MIHIATVHWQDDRWVDIQLKYLKSHLHQPFQVYAFLNGLTRDHRSKFFYSSTEAIPQHSIKLNILADLAAANSTADDDLLIFIDGDAFPIGDILGLWNRKSPQYPLVAIQRKENAGDMQPHPCFCMTTVGFWNHIHGDWNAGFTWENSLGQTVTDVGGNLLGALERRQIQWHPMLRSNRRDLHPLWFGLYEDLIYHHGAGFRSPTSRADLAQTGASHSRYYNLYGKLPKRIQKNIPKKLRPLYHIEKKNREMSEMVFAMISKDPTFYRFFLDINSTDWKINS